MRGPLSRDDVEELKWSARTPQQHRAAADQLADWAGQSHPDDEDVTPAELWVAAGEQLGMAGKWSTALVHFRHAVGAVGSAPPDTRVYLHHGLLRAGQAHEARSLAEELRRSRPADSDVFVFVAEGHEGVGDLDQAHRWFTMGLAHVERNGAQPSDTDRRMLQNGRYRVRQAMGAPLDEDDDEAATWLAARRADGPDDWS